MDSKKIVSSKSAIVDGKKVVTVYYDDGTNKTFVKDPY